MVVICERLEVGPKLFVHLGVVLRRGDDVALNLPGFGKRFLTFRDTLFAVCKVFRCDQLRSGAELVERLEERLVRLLELTVQDILCPRDCAVFASNSLDVGD